MKFQFHMWKVLFTKIPVHISSHMEINSKSMYRNRCEMIVHCIYCLFTLQICALFYNILWKNVCVAFTRRFHIKLSSSCFLSPNSSHFCGKCFKIPLPIRRLTNRTLVEIATRLPWAGETTRLGCFSLNIIVWILLTPGTSMFRKFARIDVSIDKPKDPQECKGTQNVFTVNVKLISGKFALLTWFRCWKTRSGFEYKLFGDEFKS